MFQKDPLVLLAHPDQGIEKLEDLKQLTLFVGRADVVHAARPATLARIWLMTCA